MRGRWRVHWLTVLIAVALLAGVVLIFRDFAPPLRLVWRYQAPSYIVAVRTTSDGNACVLDGDGRLTLLDSNRRQLWQTTLPPPKDGSVWSFMHCAKDGRTFVSSQGGSELAALNSDGMTLWTAVLPNLMDDYGQNVKPLAVLEDGSVFCMSGRGVVKLDKQGRELVLIALPGLHGFRPPTIAPDGSVLYFRAQGLIFENNQSVYPGDKDVFLTKMDPQGRELWRTKGDFMAAYSTAQIASDGNIWVQKRKGIGVYSPQGRQLFEMKAGADLSDNVLLDADRVYVGGWPAICAYSLDGREIWRLDTQSFTHDPMLGEGDTLFAGEEDWAEPLRLFEFRKQFDPQARRRSSLRLIAFSREGRLLRRSRLQEDASTGPPQAVGNRVILRTASNELSCFEP